MARYSGTAVVHLQGELDATTAPALAAELAAAVGEPTVLLDLTRVGTIDSVGLAALLRAIRRIQEHGGRVAAAGRPVAMTALASASIDSVAFLADSPVSGLGWLHRSGLPHPSGSGKGVHVDRAE